MIVMDCSAAVEIARNTPRGQGLLSLIEPTDKIIAPSWFQAEVRNVFWKYVHVGAMTTELALERLAVAEDLICDFIPISNYKQEAFFEAINHDHSFYDMLYVCMARRNGATLFTLDKHLIEICIQAKVNCVDEVLL